MHARPLIGVDPGAHGAIALFWPGRIKTYPVPIVRVKRGRTEKSRLDTSAYMALVRSLATLDPVCTYFEDTQGMPGQSAPAAHTFGMTCGLMEMAWHACGVPVEHVHAATWKGALRVPAGKDGARAVASKLLPHAAHQWPRKGDDGKAEASLIALWGSIHGVLR